MQVEQTQLTDVTIMHVRPWNRYLNEIKSLGKRCSDYNKHQGKTREGKRAMETIQTVCGRRYGCVGPFSTTITLNGGEMRIPVYVTRRNTFGNMIHFGEELMINGEVKVILDTNHLDRTSEARVDMADEKIRALMDSGASASYITKELYEKAGGRDEDLLDSGRRFFGLCNKPMKTEGMTQNMPFRIAGIMAKMSFIVAHDNTYDMILGRDFIIRYDVLIDIPNNQIKIRNPHQEYHITERKVVDINKPTYIATIAGDQIMPGKYIQNQTFRIRRRKKNRIKMHPESERWIAYVEEIEEGELEREGIRTIEGISMVTNGHVTAPIMNSNEKSAEPFTLNRRAGAAIYVTPVKVIYEKMTNQQLEEFRSITIAQLDNTDIGAIADSLSLKSSDTTLSSISDLPIKKTNSGFKTRPLFRHVRKDIDEEMWLRVKYMMRRHQDIFMTDESDVGLTHLIKHDIELTDEAVPFKDVPKRSSPGKRKITEDQLKDLLDSNIVQPSKSPFASSVTLIRRPNDTYRFCCDFRKLNDVTIKDTFPLPLINESIASLGNANYFTTIDMGNAIWQVPMDQASKEKTAFTIGTGLYQWNRMPFGLCNTTATFQKLMAKTLQSIENEIGDSVQCYVDVLLIATRTIEQHTAKLDQVFTCLKLAGLKLKAAKCNMFQNEIRFLGRMVKLNRIFPDPRNADKLRRCTPPRNKSELEAFLGLTSYYREFIKNYAMIAAPLAKMKQRGIDFVWEQKAQEAFEKLRSALTCEPVLRLPNQTGKFILDTDASAVGISGILQQEQIVDGQKKIVVIAYTSRGLKSKERNYSAAKLEMLAALRFIEYHRKLLLGQKFKLRFDNQALSWLKSYGNEEGTAARWIHRLNRFNLDLDHRTRDKHTNADGLSKLPSYYIRREEKPAPDRKGFSFLSQEDYDNLPALNEESLRKRKQRKTMANVGCQTKIEGITIRSKASQVHHESLEPSRVHEASRVDSAGEASELNLEQNSSSSSAFVLKEEIITAVKQESRTSTGTRDLSLQIDPHRSDLNAEEDTDIETMEDIESTSNVTETTTDPLVLPTTQRGWWPPKLHTRLIRSICNITGMQSKNCKDEMMNEPLPILKGEITDLANQGTTDASRDVASPTTVTGKQVHFVTPIVSDITGGNSASDSQNTESSEGYTTLTDEVDSGVTLGYGLFETVPKGNSPELDCQTDSSEITSEGVVPETERSDKNFLRDDLLVALKVMIDRVSDPDQIQTNSDAPDISMTTLTEIPSLDQSPPEVTELDSDVWADAKGTQSSEKSLSDDDLSYTTTRDQEEFPCNSMSPEAAMPRVDENFAREDLKPGLDDTDISPMTFKDRVWKWYNQNADSTIEQTVPAREIVEVTEDLHEHDHPIIFTIGMDLKPRGLLETFITASDLVKRIGDQIVRMGGSVKFKTELNRQIFLLILKETAFEDISESLLLEALREVLHTRDRKKDIMSMPQIGTGDGTIHWDVVKNEVLKAFSHQPVRLILHLQPEFEAAEIFKTYSHVVTVQKVDLYTVQGAIVLDASVDLQSSNSGLRREIKSLHDGWGNKGVPIPELGDVIHYELSDGRHVFYVVNRIHFYYNPDLIAYWRGMRAVSRMCIKFKITTVYTLDLVHDHKACKTSNIREVLRSSFEDTSIRVIVASTSI
jgi:hypothetical protein